MFVAIDKHNLKVTGVPHGWDMWVYVLQYTNIVMLFNIFVLISCSWCFLKLLLQNSDKNVCYCDHPSTFG